MTPSHSPSVAVLLTLFGFIAASVWLGTQAQKVVSKGKFLEGFFLGNRGLGAWALALTATVQSGGTFMGFPSLVYSHGWIVSVWIASYMIVPITGFAVVGKRLSHLSRQTQAITVPDLFRERYQSPALGLTASLIVMFTMTVMMIAQFKAGAIVMQLAWPGSGFLSFSEEADLSSNATYYAGLAIFATTVIGYTLIGGFLASVWTDLFQSVMMLFGVIILLALALSATGGLEAASREAVRQTSIDFAQGPGLASTTPSGVQQQFLTTGLAISMFFIWPWGGFASPASMVRVMAAQNSEVIRKSITLLSLYNCLIYIPLIMICVAARSIFPNLEKPDETIPRMALHLTHGIPGGSVISGLILAAPFGAIMATVSCYLLVISSGIVRDIYMRFVRPMASDHEIRLMTTFSMIAVGTVAILANLNPPPYLQALVVLSGSSAAAAFAIPVLMACYSKRSTAAGVLSGMLGGLATMIGLYALGWCHTWSLAVIQASGPQANPLAHLVAGFLGPEQGLGIVNPLRPYFLGGLDPLLWGLLVSALLTIGVSRVTKSPDESHLQKMFS